MRALVGPQVPIGASHDMHANLSRRMVDLATVTTVDRTNPNLDASERALGWARLLVRAIRGQARPVQALACAADERDASIVGSWMVFITYSSTAARTRGLASFTPGGCFIGPISAFEGAPLRPTPSRGTTLHGSWRRTDGREFAVTAVRLHLDALGTLLGVMTTQIALEMNTDGDSWSGEFSFTAADPAGNVTRSDQGRIHASRIGGA